MKNIIQTILQEHQPQTIGQQKHYAVFIPFIKINQSWHLIYQIRAQHISQGGQTAFPGGMIENNETSRQTAIRETAEELQINQKNIEVWAEMDQLVTDWAIIHCFVGEIIEISYDSIQPSKAEVDRLFTLPLDWLLGQTPVKQTVAYRAEPDADFPYDLINEGVKPPFRVQQHSIILYDLPDEKLWGMTATLTYQLVTILKQGFNHLNS